MDSKIIILFNHKGGVSKTTTTYNLAWKMTDHDKKVLIVDGDPQCNLTSLILGDAFEDYYISDKTKYNNIKDGVEVAFKGKPKPIEAIDCINADGNKNLFLIPGHMDLSEYDPALSLSLNSNNAISTLQNLPGAFYELINKCSEKYQIDYVFIDMNPGLSAINQTFFMYADAFIIPTNPDPFSVMALRTLKTVLPRWKNSTKIFRDFFKDASYPLPNKEMKFIGEVIQRFNLRRGKAAVPYQERITEIKEYIEKELVIEFERNDMVYDISNLITKGIISDRCLAEISEFGALLPKSHYAGVPVFALSPSQINETGPILEQMISKRDLINGIFDNFAKAVLEILK